MFSLEGLQQQLAQYQAQQKSAEQLFHQCAGVIAMLSQQITLLHQAEQMKLEALKKEAEEQGEQHGEVVEQAEGQTAEV